MNRTIQRLPLAGIWPAAAFLALPLLLLGLTALLPLMVLVGTLLASFENWEGAWSRLQNTGAFSLIGFTLWQACWSAGLTILGAFLVAALLVRRSFPGRKLLLGLSMVPFALPSVVVAFAFVVVLGNSGYVTEWLAGWGLRVEFLYNRWAIVAAHLFFNLPFCTRALLTSWEGLPMVERRSVRLLGLSPLQGFFVAELPQLLRPALSLTLLTFSLCLGSFGVVLVLGGRPEFSTVEVGIYQLIRYDFDLEGAGLLALAQLLLTLLAAGIYRWSVRRERGFSGTPMRSEGFLPLSPWRGIGLLPYVLFLLLPLAGVGVDGLRAMPVLMSAHSSLLAEAWPALVTSLGIAVTTGLFSVVVALCLARGSLMVRGLYPRLTAVVQESVWLLVGVSPTVLAFCWLLLLRGNPFGHAYWAVVAVHVALSLPLSVRVLLPALERIWTAGERSADALGLSLARRVFKVELPALRIPLMVSFGAGFAFSFGEVAATSVFSGGGLETLPVLIFRLMGAYRFGDAALVTLILAGVCAFFSYLAEERSA